MRMLLKRLIDLRESQNLKQKEIAAFINISTRSYSHYERGDRSIPLEILIRLADFYDVSLDYVVGRKDK